MDIKIISGGQTGADRGGLEGAKVIGLKTGGSAPIGYRTENGKDYSLKAFGLIESKSWNYRDRTRENIINSDKTIIFADKKNSPGTKQTINMAIINNKPYIINPTITQFICFINTCKIINIAGNRESVAPGLQDKVKNFIIKAFKQID